tara:strand:+ start:295 stop:495 length:201 start_codon:yes stop_codon:yes gene_type:complete
MGGGVIIMDNMIINSARYTLGSDGNNSAINATIDGVEMSVPLDPANRHYEAILEWVADGNTIEAAS